MAALRASGAVPCGLWYDAIKTGAGDRRGIAGHETRGQ